MDEIVPGLVEHSERLSLQDGCTHLQKSPTTMEPQHPVGSSKINNCQTTTVLTDRGIEKKMTLHTHHCILIFGDRRIKGTKIRTDEVMWTRPSLG